MNKQIFALHCGRYNSENEFEEYVETVEVTPSPGKAGHFYASSDNWGCSKDRRQEPRDVALYLAQEHAASVRKVEELPTYRAFEEAARAAHERRFAEKGDAYATAEEMAYLRDYPLEHFDAVAAQVCLELGAKIGLYGRVLYMSPSDRALFERQLPAPAVVEEPAEAETLAARLGGRTVDLGIDLTPAWAGVLPVLLLGYAEGTPEGQRLARKELERMARLADLYVAGQMAENKA